MYQMKTFLQLIGLIIAMAISANSSAKVSMTIDRTDIAAGETFILDLQIDEDTDQQPDLSRIPKEFTIVSTSQYHNTQIFNGKRSTLIGWKIKLKTLQSGPITIPPITLGNESTQPISLNIRDSSNQVDLNGESKVIYLEADVDRTDVYVQQQLIYTVTLYRAVNTHYASLSEPVVDNSILEKLGDDIQFEKFIDNRRYIVTQRKYAIYPQQSGKLTISPVNFTADINDNSQRNRGGFLSATRPVSVSTQPVTIAVKRKPTSAANPWLPASEVILADKWTPDKKTLKVGEPITWTLLLTASGLTESQLPDISLPKIDGLQLYPDTPQKERQINEKGFVGQRIEKLAVIPSKEGSVTIPAITIDWWDVNSNSAKTAKLPARTFKILPADESTQVLPPVEPPQVEQLPHETTLYYEETLRRWQLICAVVLGLWLLTLALYFKKASQLNQSIKQADPVNRRRENQDAKRIFSNLKTSLQKQDGKEIERLLIALVNQLGHPAIRSLGALAERVKTKSIVDKLHFLDANLYSATQHRLDPPLTKSDIDQIIRDIDRRQNSAASSDIPPLYPR